MERKSLGRALLRKERQIRKILHEEGSCIFIDFLWAIK